MGDGEGQRGMEKGRQGEERIGDGGTVGTVRIRDGEGTVGIEGMEKGPLGE